ncbi:hypothetical protein V565_174700 [Rhizoctonia solani 123E]|uniref:Uncharacterized protein n=1 Tax=Rhizoctonia solani 123E TaxID=1423351 RepID=A0A074RJD9_9AGAM|nr:hypothetical protein V565_174700 [Rhizoctonia solani 123E]
MRYQLLATRATFPSSNRNGWAQRGRSCSHSTTGPGSSRYETGSVSSIETTSDTILPPRLAAPGIHESSSHFESGTPPTVESISGTVFPPNLIAPGLRGESETPACLLSRHSSESVSSFISGSTATLLGLMPPASRDASTVHPASLAFIGYISPMSNLPPLQHPGLQVPILTMGPSVLSGSSAHSTLSLSVSSVSLASMPSIIVPHTAPPSASSPESHRLTINSWYYPVYPWYSNPVYPYRLIVIPQSQYLYPIYHDSRDRCVLPEPAEYKPAWSGLEGTLSIISGTTASREYDIVRQYPPTPSLPTAKSLPPIESMEGAAIDNESLQDMSGELDFCPATPLGIAPSEAESSISSKTTITLPPQPSLGTTQASSISEGNKPSIETLPSGAESIYSDRDLNKGTVPPSHIVSQDVNRLLQYLHEVITVRKGETWDMTDHLHPFEEYVPMSDASTDVSISSREEEATPIAVAIPARLKSEIFSLDLTESIASLTQPSPTIASVSISDESSLSDSFLTDSSITGSPTALVSEISGASGGMVSFSIPSTHIPFCSAYPFLLPSAQPQHLNLLPCHYNPLTGLPGALLALYQDFGSHTHYFGSV